MGFTDTPDENWLMCEDPRWSNLYLASGDSGLVCNVLPFRTKSSLLISLTGICRHSFHTLPIIGGYIADMLEGKLSHDDMKAWAWRPGQGDPNGTGRPGPPPRDLADLSDHMKWAEDGGKGV